MSKVARKNEVLSPFKHLWKIEDKEWVLRRRSDWKILEANGFKNFTKAEKRVRKAFFLTGEWLEFISEPVLLFLTPLSSPEDARQIFYSKVFGRGGRSKIFSSYLRKATTLGAGVDWLPQQIRYFVDGVLGHEYQVIEESQAHTKEVISPEPNFFCNTFIVDARMLFTNEIPYRGCVEAVDYFVSALAHVDKPDVKNMEVINALFDLVNAAFKDSSASEVAKRFAQELKENEVKIREVVEESQ